MDFEALIPIFGIIFTFGIPGLIILTYFYIRHRERMRLIEKGLTPDEVKSYFSSAENRTKTKSTYGALKWGLLLTFIGLGILFSNLLYEFYDLDEGVSVGVTIMFAGLGFLVYYFIVRNKIKSDEERQVQESNN